MLLKLALRNVRRSARDYAVYFVTLVLGVAVFYAFNSIGSQEVLFDLETAAAGWLDEIQFVLGLFSSVVAVVLGFLVVYANRFIIRRRKHEFGTYQLLGMGPGRISRLVLYETALVGIASLGLGLALGIALSQGLSFASAALMGTMLQRYRFVFSFEALAMTLACFALIYVVVALLNLRAVTRSNLADLLQARKRGERVAMRSPWACLLVFAGAVCLLAAAYKLLIESGMVMLDDPRFAGATALMLIGTLLFFWSLAGFATTLLRRVPGAYLKGLRAFTVRQVSERINTAFASLWAVCVLLFFSVTVFSVGMGMVDVFTGSIREAAPYDASMRADYYYAEQRESGSMPAMRTQEAMAQAQPEVYAEAQRWDFSALAKLEAEVPGWSDAVQAAAQLDVYEYVYLSYADIVDAETAAADLTAVGLTAEETPLALVGLSQYNATARLTGQEEARLEAGECVISNAFDGTAALAQAAAETGARVEVAGHSLSFQPEVLRLQAYNSAMVDTSMLIVVGDEVIASLREAGIVPSFGHVNVQYARDGEAADAFMMDAMSLVNTGEVIEGFALPTWPVSYFALQSQMVAQAGGLKLLITYLAVYIGFVFLVATAAVLAIQQLTGTTDSLERYRQLAHLGCDESDILGSLRTQTCLYFLLPLGLALCHTACAVGVLNATFFSLLGTDVLQPVVLAVGLLVVIYGGYLAVTYLTSRSMVKAAVR